MGLFILEKKLGTITLTFTIEKTYSEEIPESEIVAGHDIATTNSVSLSKGWTVLIWNLEKQTSSCLSGG